MRYLKRGLAAVLALIVGAFIVSELWVESTARMMLAGLYWSAGLEQKSVTTSVGDIAYLEGGEGETVVFLHGIFALKEHWIDMSRQVSGDYRVILIDLPGFGENRRLDPEDYNYTRQTENVLETLDQIGVERFHLAANSMGAQIAGQLATSIPDRVLSLAFVGSPVGVTSPERSDMELAISAGQLPLVVETGEEYDNRMDWLFPQEPFIPRPIARYWRDNEVSNAVHNRQIWRAVAAFDGLQVGDLARHIHQPSLVIWCEEDRIFHTSGSTVLTEALQNPTLQVLNECGHLPMLDRPQESGGILLEFLRQTN
ncbi:MAG: alpha/beta hydrolase [Hyphomicrobiales bacterium]